MQDLRLTMSVSSGEAAKLWTEAAALNGASARHMPGMMLELVFPTTDAKEHFASVLNLTVQTLSRRPGRA